MRKGELKTGEMYRGHLMNCEDNMNAMLEGVTVTGRDGKVTNLEQAGWKKKSKDLVLNGSNKMVDSGMVILHIY